MISQSNKREKKKVERTLGAFLLEVVQKSLRVR